MKIIRKNRILVAIFIVAALSASFVFLLFNGSRGIAVFDEIEIRAEYKKNETFTVPETSVSVGNSSYQAVSVLEFPDGKTTGSKSVVLSDAGKYRLTYRAVVSGKVYEKNYEFGVKDTVYEVSGNGASVEFGAHEYVPDVNGLLLTLTRGATFKYKKIIDVSGLSGEEVLFNFYILPEKIGTLDVSKINITLTDVYDESNYITLTAKSKLATAEDPNNNSMCTANPAGQMSIGLEKCKENETTGNYPIITWNGARWKKFVGNQFGSYLGGYVSFIGLPRFGDITNNSIAFCLDYDNKVVYNQNYIGEKNPVADLDDLSMFSNPWKGFTTGECFISVSGETFQNSKATILITDILSENLGAENVFVDEEKPELTVEFDGYEDNVPVGATGEKYNIFGASAFDKHDGETSVSVNVFYDYYNKDGRVNVYTNGKYFLPKKAGIYVVEYSARDKAGNLAVIPVPVKIISDDDNTRLKIHFNDDGDLYGSIGNEIKIKSVDLQNAKGRSGYKAYAENENAGVRYEIAEDLKFTPLYSGKYKIVYEFYDYVYCKIQEYEINVSAGDNGYLEAKNLAIPKYLIKNAEYVFPEVKSYFFTDGKPYVVQTFIAVYNDESDSYKIFENSDKIKIEAERSVRLRYYATAAGSGNEKPAPDDRNAVYKDFVINDVRDVGYNSSDLDMAKYFAVEGFNAFAKNEYVELSAVNGASRAEAEFINMLGISGFAFNVKVLSGSAGKINVFLNDAINGDVLYKISYMLGNSAVNIVINDRDSYTVAKTEDDIRCSVYYSNETISPYYGNTMSAGNLYNGEGFNNFIGRKIYLKFEAENISTNFRFAVSKICNQPITNSASDKIAPVVSDIDISGNYEIDKKMILRPAYSYDVLSPYTEFRLGIIGPDGSFVANVDGKQIKNSDPNTGEELILDKYGKYSFRYIATDGSSVGRINEQIRYINVIDVEKPSIILDEGQTEGKVNKEIKIAGYSVKDNLSKDLSVNIYVIAPDNSIIKISSGVFTPRLSGVYKVYYSVKDDQGNLSQSYYKIKVRGN